MRSNSKRNTKQKTSHRKFSPEDSAEIIQIGVAYEKKSPTIKGMKLKLCWQLLTGLNIPLLQLKQQYCDNKRCLDCAIGNRILQEEAVVYGGVKR